MVALLPLILLVAAPTLRTWTVDGVKREALVVIPTGKPTRLVFDFHGHGGTARHAARAHALHTHLPDAVVVYPQGLNTPTKLVDPEGKRSGWQLTTGERGNRDIKLFVGRTVEQAGRSGSGCRSQWPAGDCQTHPETVSACRR